MTREISRYPIIRRPSSRRTSVRRIRLFVEALERRDVPSFMAGNFVNVGGVPDALAIADFNADSHNDLVIINRGANIAIFLGDGNGDLQRNTFYTAGSTPEGVAVDDFDNDGHTDVANTNWGSGTITVALGNGDGKFQAAKHFSAGFQPFGIVSGDFDEDGDSDIVVTNKWVSGGVSLLLNDGNASFEIYAVYGLGAGFEVVRTTDFNNDGHADLLAHEYVLLGNGNGSFQDAKPLAGNWGDVVAADVNGDGFTDIVGTFDIGSENAVGYAQGKGNGLFQPAKVFQAGRNPWRIASADFDGDGDSDIVVGSRDDETITVMSSVNGALRQRTTYVVGDTPAAIVTSDFTSDGIPDVVTANDYSGSLSLVIGIGDGSFHASTGYYVTNGYARSITGIDMTDDDVLDLVIAEGGDEKSGVAILEGAADGTFVVGPTYDVGSNPLSVIVEDLDDNGFLDLAATNQFYYVTVSPGSESGFTRPPLYHAGAEPSDVAIGDLDGDGIIDLVVSDNGKNGGFAVFIGNGDGVFHLRAEYRGKPFNAAVLADLNGDTKLDLALASSSYIWTALGNGDGTFAPYVRSSSVSGDIKSLETCDLDGDRNLDLAVASYDDLPGGNGAMLVMLGNGDGTFSAPSSNLQSGARAVATGDFNGDTVLDLAVGWLGLNTAGLSVLFGNGDGTFTQPAQLWSKFGAADVVIGDFDGNGFLDIAVSMYTEIRVSLSNGDGTFLPYIAAPVSPSPGRLAVVDVDLDSSLDLIAVNRYDSENYTAVNVIRGNGDGTFKPRVAYFVGDVPIALGTVDFNGDAFPDIAAISDTKLRVLINDGDGTFPAATGYNATGPSGLATGDFNRDGLSDLAIGSTYWNLVVYLADGSPGGYAGPFEYPVELGGARDVVVADFDANGILDIAAANRTAFGTVSVYLGNGDGTFQLAITSPAGYSPWQLATDDLNGDGYADVVLTSDMSAGLVTAILGNGDGTFDAPQTYATGTARCHEIILADFNNDGIPDIATGAASTVVVMLGNGDGTFQNPLKYAVLNVFDFEFSGVDVPSKHFTVGDFNSDGFVDLAVLNSKAVAIIINSGSWTPLPIDGERNPAVQLVTAYRPTKVTTYLNAADKQVPEDRTIRSLVTGAEKTGKTLLTPPRFRPELRAPRAAGPAVLDLDLT